MMHLLKATYSKYVQLPLGRELDVIPLTQTAECAFCPHTAFPLIFIKRFQRSWPQDKEGPETVPESESDFEEITSAEKQTVCYIEHILHLLETELIKLILLELSHHWELYIK